MCIISKIETIRKKAKQKNRKCWIPTCTNKCIDSHLLQKNGIISNIAEDNHVYQLTYYAFIDPPAKLKKISVNKVFTFKGFCSHHDNHVFKYIENGQLDLNDYKAQLLFTYRAVINEARKKEVAIDENERILRDNSLTVNKTGIRELIHGFKLGIDDCAVLLKEINDNIKDVTVENFIFHHIEIAEKLPICASGIFTSETTEEMLETRNNLQTDDFLINEIYLNVLPFDNTTSLLIGTKSTASRECLNYINNLIGQTGDVLKKSISDILIGRMENWIISPSLYQNLLEHEETLRNLYVYTGMRLNEADVIDFNLFDHI